MVVTRALISFSERLDISTSTCATDELRNEPAHCGRRSPVTSLSSCIGVADCPSHRVRHFALELSHQGAWLLFFKGFRWPIFFSSLRSALTPHGSARVYAPRKADTHRGGNMQLNTCACDDMCKNLKASCVMIRSCVCSYAIIKH